MDRLLPEPRRDLWPHAVKVGRSFTRWDEAKGWVFTNRATLVRRLTATPHGVRVEIREDEVGPGEHVWEFYGLSGPDNPGPYSLVSLHPDAVRADLERVELGGQLRKPRRRKRGTGGPL